MAILGTFVKQPADRLDYDVDYTDWLTVGDSIESTVVSVSPATLTIDSTFNNTPRIKIWLFGGVDKVRYKVTLTSTTADGRVKQDEFLVVVKDT